jgi:hypothetical protein
MSGNGEKDEKKDHVFSFSGFGKGVLGALGVEITPDGKADEEPIKVAPAQSVIQPTNHEVKSEVVVFDEQTAVYYKVFVDALKKGAAAAFFKFVEKKKKLETIVKGEAELCQAALVALEDSGVQQVDIITAQAQALELLDVEFKKASDNVNAKDKEIISSKETELARNAQAILNLEGQLAELKKRQGELNQEVSDAKGKLESIKACLLSAYNRLKQEIRKDKLEIKEGGK